MYGIISKIRVKTAARENDLIVRSDALLEMDKLAEKLIDGAIQECLADPAARGYLKREHVIRARKRISAL